MKFKTLLLAVTSTALSSLAFAASHSDAPLSKLDPQTNITDVYAFIGTKYDDANVKVLNVIVQVRPFSEPGDGVMYDKFSADALYSIHITNPTTAATLRRYDFRFSSTSATSFKNQDTILSYGLGTAAGSIQIVGDAQQNYVQTYTVTKVDGTTSTVIGTALKCPPPNVGALTTPHYNNAGGIAISGAATFAALDKYTKETVYGTNTNEAVFAGPREDGFYADTAGIFDFLNSRILDRNGSLADGLGQDGGGVDGFKGYNVLSYAIQIPVTDLPSLGFTSPFSGAANGVGVYATVSRQRSTVQTADGPISSGPWVQVNRMGNPLFNEVLVAVRDKDKYNRTSPTQDAANFGQYASTNEVAALLNTIYSTAFVTTGRADLTAVYIPDVIRVNTTTVPVRLAGQPGFSRLGFIGGDTTDGVSGGWPNGRRLGDDVVDIALTAVASGPSYSAITLAGDNVHTNDQLYNQVFPYSGTPHSGTVNRKDP